MHNESKTPPPVVTASDIAAVNVDIDTGNPLSGEPGPAKDDKKRAQETPSEPGLPGTELPKEWGGRDGPEPTRYGDWEKKGRCIDF
jgi:hypothetical protein